MKRDRVASLPRHAEANCDETCTPGPRIERRLGEGQAMVSRSVRRRQLPVHASAATTNRGPAITWALR